MRRPSLQDRPNLDVPSSLEVAGQGTPAENRVRYMGVVDENSRSSKSSTTALPPLVPPADVRNAVSLAGAKATAGSRRVTLSSLPHGAPAFPASSAATPSSLSSSSTTLAASSSASASSDNTRSRRATAPIGLSLSGGLSGGGDPPSSVVVDGSAVADGGAVAATDSHWTALQVAVEAGERPKTPPNLNLRRVSVAQLQPCVLCGMDPEGKKREIGVFDASTSDEPQAAMRRLCREGVAALIARMELYPYDDQVQYWGSWNLAKLTSTETNSIDVVERGGLALMHRTVKSTKNSRIVSQALLLLASLAAYTDNRTAIVKSGIIPTTIKKM